VAAAAVGFLTSGQHDGNHVSQRPENKTMKALLKQSLGAVVCVLVVIAAIIWCVRVFRQDAAVELGPYTAAGELLADEAAKLLNGQGKIVVLALDTQKIPIPYADAQLKAFQNRLKKKSRITIVAIERVSPSSGEGMISLSGAKYTEVVRQYDGADAIVSFIGSPGLTESELRQLPAKRPLGIVFGDTMGAQIQRLFRVGLVQVAVTKRFTPLSGPGREPQTSKEWFDFYFELVATNNANPQ
jgi:hypothetical protein